MFLVGVFSINYKSKQHNILSVKDLNNLLMFLSSKTEIKLCKLNKECVVYTTIRKIINSDQKFKIYVEKEEGKYEDRNKKKSYHKTFHPVLVPPPPCVIYDP